MVEEKFVYVFWYKLLQEDNTSTFSIPIRVLADAYGKARRIAEEWLETEGHKAYKYKEWVGCNLQPSETILVETT